MKFEKGSFSSLPLLTTAADSAFYALRLLLKLGMVCAIQATVKMVSWLSNITEEENLAVYKAGVPSNTENYIIRLCSIHK